MDKSWVWLPRTSLEYKQGATDFVYGSAKRLGNPAKMFCPCLQCRNLCHQLVATVLDHLVIKGMDQKYKKNKCWSKHGEIRELKTSDEQTSECEAYELFRATFFDGDDNLQPRSDTPDQNDGIEEEADKEFMKKLEDAETPLYNSCPNYTKVSVGDAMGTKIAWPFDNLILDSMDSPTANKTDGSSATNALEDRIQIIAWTNDAEVIAEGYMVSTDPTEMVNNIHLGPNAAKIKIDKVINKDAYLWRPNEEMKVIGDALFAYVAWPVSKVLLCEGARPTKNSSSKVPSVAKGAVPSKVSSSKNSSPKSVANISGISVSPKKNCLLLDCFGSGQMVAEGKVLSDNPEDKVHFVPLGPNASKVWVEVCKIDDAHVWRQNSEFQIVVDALGSTIAWPNDKIVYM
ncbi:hypothetical protein Bca4012_100006 [Brassica carinata]